MKMEMPKLKM